MSRDPMLQPLRYAELHCVSNFTFLRGASHPQELVEQADTLGYTAIAITDECSVAGVVRAHMTAKGKSLKLIIGAEFRLQCGLRFVALAIDRYGYGRLCRFITRGRRSASKGEYSLTRADVEELGLEQCFILWLPDRRAPDASQASWLAERFSRERLRIAVELLCEGADREQLATLQGIGRKLIQFVENKAREMNLNELITLSTQAFTYFQSKGGFAEGRPDDLPPARRDKYEHSGRNSKVLVKRLR